MTNFKPDQTSVTAHTLMSTKPSGRPTSRIVSSVMSVGTFADFFGHYRNRTVGPYAASQAAELFDQRRLTVHKDMDHVRGFADFGVECDARRNRLEQPQIIRGCVLCENTSIRRYTKFFGEGSARIPRCHSFHMRPQDEVEAPGWRAFHIGRFTPLTVSHRASPNSATKPGSMSQGKRYRPANAGANICMRLKTA